MGLDKDMVLPYYKIERTDEGRQFFYSHIGYFNFWNEYLIANTRESNREVFWVIVNRTGRTFSGGNSTDKQKLDIKTSLADSLCLRLPKEMFTDFPELEDYDDLRWYSKYWMREVK